MSFAFATLASLLALSTGAGAAPSASATVASAWYAGWHESDFPLSAVPWAKYTSLTYAFAVTTPDVKKLGLTSDDEDLIPQFVSTAQKNVGHLSPFVYGHAKALFQNVKALVSVGGWTGSRWFSTAVGSASNRTAFVKTITDFATKYKLDGIDFDWEYPGNQGIGCNVVSSKDTSNFASFLTELRQNSVGKNLILTAATPISPWLDANGDPSESVATFAKTLDYIQIMNYDIWGPWSATVGPNAPLNDTCAPSAAQQGSAVSAVSAWTDAGMPAAQIVLGVAGYGHSFKVSPSNAFVKGSTTQLASYPPFDASNTPTGDKWDDPAGVDECGNEEGQGGLFDFWGLIDAGFLTANGTAAPGIASRFDSCTQTPYVYNQKTQVMVAYDDTKSFAAKGSFIKSKGLRGFAMWEAGGDSKALLIDSIRKGAGF